MVSALWLAREVAYSRKDAAREPAAGCGPPRLVRRLGAMRSAILIATVTLLLTARVVRADVPPIDQCSKEGSACNNAGDVGNKAGACVKTTCSRLNKGTGQSEQVECLRCVEGRAPARKRGCAIAPGRDPSADLGLLFAAVAAFGAYRRSRSAGR